jgi:hypothetical protein
MKRRLILISLLAFLLLGATRPVDTIRLTVINKAEMDIAIRLTSKTYQCANSADVVYGDFYYLTVLEGSREQPNVKVFEVQKNDYAMQLYYLETYDPVYGYKCETPSINILMARRNIRLSVLPCTFKMGPKQVGEPTMRKYVPYVNKTYFERLFKVYHLFHIQKYWLSRLIN